MKETPIPHVQLSDDVDAGIISQSEANRIAEIYSYQGVCEKHNVTITSNTIHGLIGALQGHSEQFGFTCGGISIDILKDGKILGK